MQRYATQCFASPQTAGAPLRAVQPGESAGEQQADVVYFGQGDEIYGQGAPADAIFVLLVGRVRLVQRTPARPAMVTGVLRPGALFGLDSLAQGGYAESAVAETACSVRVVPVALLDRLLAHGSGVAAGLLEALLRRRCAAERLLTRALVAGVPGRLAGALLDAAEHGIVGGQTRQELADAAWTTRETATRVLFQFADEGLVRVDGRRIELLEVESLRRIAGGSRQLPAA